MSQSGTFLLFCFQWSLKGLTEPSNGLGKELAILHSLGKVMQSWQVLFHAALSLTSCHDHCSF